jgi:hypothetical protein
MVQNGCDVKILLYGIMNTAKKHTEGQEWCRCKEWDIKERELH